MRGLSALQVDRLTDARFDTHRPIEARIRAIGQCADLPRIPIRIAP
jgi:Zn-dependent protease with chaperone function